MAALYVILGLAVLLPLSGLVDLMLTSQRYDVSAGLQAATSSERVATIEHLFYQDLVRYAITKQASSSTTPTSTTPTSTTPTIDSTTVCPVFAGNSELQLVSTAASSTLMVGCSYASKSSPLVRLEVKAAVSASSPSTPLSLAPKSIVITQACVVTASQDGCLSAYSS